MTFRDGDLLWLLLGIPVLAALPVLAWWLREHRDTQEQPQEITVPEGHGHLRK